MQRNNVCMTARSEMLGKIGRLQCLHSIPVIAGESVAVEADVVTRLAGLRKYAVMTPQVDIFGFFTPYRHVDSEWPNFLLAGTDELTTFGTHDLGTAEETECLGIGTATGTVSKFYPITYIQTWNEYFRDPTTITDILPDDWFVDGASVEALSADRVFGKACCHLPEYWNTGVNENQVNDTDKRFALVDTDKIDVLLLAETKARYESEIRKDWESTP